MTERGRIIIANVGRPEDITTISQKDISRLGSRLIAAPILSKVTTQQKVLSRKSSVVKKINLKTRSSLQHDFHREFGVKELNINKSEMVEKRSPSSKVSEMKIVKSIASAQQRKPLKALNKDITVPI